ncbi:MAG: protein-L-isoaspartate O-methyltransferase [Myxococcota bacterium]
MSTVALAQGLVIAEDRLRAQGLTGSAAFDALVSAWRCRLMGEPVPQALRAAVEAIPNASGGAVLGLAYERFFPDVFKGLRGQFFTPPPIARLLVGRLAVAAGESVLDPTCGSGALLTLAGERGAVLHGCEIDSRLAELARVQLLHRGLQSDIVVGDAFAVDLEPADVVVANPPFSVRLDSAAVRDAMDWPDHRRLSSDQAFAHRLASWVRPGGRAGVVLPYSVVANANHVDTRKRLLDAFDLTAVCVLPEGVFRPFGGAQGRAALVWLVRHPTRTDTVLWSRVDDPGYDVSSRRLQHTKSPEMAERRAGHGWQALSQNTWLPAVEAPVGTTVGDVATACEVRVYPSKTATSTVCRLDLSEPNRPLGEVVRLPRVHAGSLKGVRLSFLAGTVLVSRLRPTQSNVTVVPVLVNGESCVGSPEWLPLQTESPRVLFHLLRTPAWRDGLPVGTGQTRPRVHVDAVLNSPIRWPSNTTVVALEQASQQLADARSYLAGQLLTLQDAVDAFAAGDMDDEALMSVVSSLSIHPQDDSSR